MIAIAKTTGIINCRCVQKNCTVIKAVHEKKTFLKAEFETGFI